MNHHHRRTAGEGRDPSAISARARPRITSPPSLTTRNVATVTGSPRTRAEPLVEAEHEVHVLDGLTGSALDQVVRHAEAGDQASVAFDRARNECDLGVVRARNGDDLRQPASRRAHERLPLVGRASSDVELFLRDRRRHVNERGREDAPREGRRDRDEPEGDRARARGEQGLLDLRHVLVAQGLVGPEVAVANRVVRAGARRDPATARARDSRPSRPSPRASPSSPAA